MDDTFLLVTLFRAEAAGGIPLANPLLDVKESIDAYQNAFANGDPEGVLAALSTLGRTATAGRKALKASIAAHMEASTL